jgi:phospholipid/cholesterol/gamma-HCH transport system permease protein
MADSAPFSKNAAGELCLRLPEGGIDPAWLARPLSELGVNAAASFGSLRVKMPASGRWNTQDAAFLARCLAELKLSELKGAPPALTKLLAVARSGQSAPVEDGSGTVRRVTSPTAFLGMVGEVVLDLPRLLLGRARVRRADVLEVLAESSSRALPIVAVTNVLMGAILAFVGAVQLKAFGAGIYVSNLVGIASVRELTPILTAIVLAGRTGASFAASIATMQANEEIDALTALGVRAAEFLVLPRVVALGLLTPLLYVYGCGFALLGGMATAVPLVDVSSAAYAAQTKQAIAGAQFAIGGLKALVFGVLVALIGCYCGLRAPRSAAGVGSATTSAVVASIIGVIALDAVFAVCANVLHL